MNSTGLSSLPAMFAELREAPPIVQPSALWETLNERNIHQLEDQGFSEFKRTVNGHYFQFIPPATKGSEQLRAVARDFVRHPRPGVLRARVIDDFEIPELWGQGKREMRARRYALYVAALWEHARRRDSRGLLDHLDEPALGHPVAVRHRGRMITEDLCNSFEELTAMLDGMAIAAMPAGSRMIELGAGYGRLAWAFLASFPGMRCVIVDIPPALAVSERYLTEVFTERPAFRFRHFEGYEDVRQELEHSEIAFITPNQLDLIPPMEADLFATVSSLHEMRPEQIVHYIDGVARHTAPGGNFYLKQWESYSNPTDEVTIQRQDYPIPADWDLVFDRPHPIQTLFFEAMYRLPSGTE